MKTYEKAMKPMKPNENPMKTYANSMKTHENLWKPYEKAMETYENSKKTYETLPVWTWCPAKNLTGFTVYYTARSAAAKFWALHNILRGAKRRGEKNQVFTVYYA